jgi:ABC-2 type transport system permease protein
MQNYPVVLLNTVLSPLSILLVIVFVSRGSLFGVGIMGGFIMAMFSAGMSMSSDLSHLKNDFKIQDMIVSSPTGWLTYMIGISLSEIVYAIPALIVLAALATFGLSFTLVETLEFISVLLLIFITSISIGYTLSTFSSDIVQSFAFTRLISTFFSTIPPVYYPITYIPLPFRYLAYLSPTTYAAELVQGISGYLSLSLTQVIIDWTVLISVTIALFVLAKTKARWREV